MTKTSLDVTTEALRSIGVTAVDESAEATDHARALSHLEAIYATLDETEGMALAWTIETVPDTLFLPLSMMVAGSVCLGYQKPEYSVMYDAGLRKVRAAEFGNEPAFTAPGVYF